ncbi:MAG: glutamine transport system substrate-binding protein [Clostridia bacterium]|nr:glutamine transport system substrate-binding protein [Clostridia bacterium]
MFVLFLLIGVTGCGNNKFQNSNKDLQFDSQNSAKPTYSVALEATYEPFEFRQMKNSKITGFDVELIQAIGKVSGFNVEFHEMRFESILGALKTNNADMAISAISIEDNIKKDVYFSLPYFQTGLVVAVRRDNDTIKGFEDLKGKEIAVQINTASSKEARKIPGARIKEWEEISDIFVELKNGGVDAVINDFPMTAYYINQGNNDLKIVGEVKSVKHFGIAVAKDQTELLQKINKGLKTLKNTGEFVRIYNKWFGQQPPTFLPGNPPKQEDLSSQENLSAKKIILMKKLMNRKHSLCKKLN